MAEVPFWSIPSDLTIWTLLNSQILATSVGALVAFLVAKYGKKAADAAVDSAAEQSAQTATQQAFQLEEEAAEQAEKELEKFESAGGEEALKDAQNFRDQAKNLIANAKKFLDDAAANDRDGRHRRTYQAISRYDYIPLAVALSARGQLSDQQLAAAVSLFSRWKLYERGRAANKSATSDVLDRLQEWSDALTNPS